VRCGGPITPDCSARIPRLFAHINLSDHVTKYTHTRRLSLLTFFGSLSQIGTTHRVSIASLNSATRLLRSRKVAAAAKKRVRDESDDDDNIEISQ